MLADNPNLVGDQKLIDLLKFAPEQTVKCVIELDLVAIPTRSSVTHARVRP
jgi:hypothetical protein